MASGLEWFKHNSTSLQCGGRGGMVNTGHYSGRGGMVNTQVPTGGGGGHGKHRRYSGEGRGHG